MDFTTFRGATDAEEIPAGLGAPLRALWHAARGQWDAAHRIVQAESDADSAWVHAYLHRVEGDLPNARHWYARAARPECTDALETEWATVARALLEAS